MYLEGMFVMKMLKTIGLSLAVIALVLSGCTQQVSVTETAALTQSIVAEDTLGGTLRVEYPEGWFARPHASFPGTIQVATTEAVLDQESGALPAGQVAGQVTFLPPAALDGLGLDRTADATAVLNAFSGQFLGESATSLSLGANDSFAAGDREAVSFTATLTENGESLETQLVAVPVADGFAILFFGAAPGQLTAFVDEIRAITGQVSYVPAAPAAEATTEATTEATPDATPEATAPGD